MSPKPFRTQVRIAALALALAPSALAQGLSVSLPGSDAALDALLPAPVAVARARVGDRLATVQHELFLAPDQGAPIQAKQFGWSKGVRVPFRLTYDGFGELTYTVGAKSLKLDSSGPFEGIGLRVAASDPGSSFAVENLTLNADVIASDLLAEPQGANPGVRHMLLHGVALQSGFVLRGELILGWSGLAPRGDELELELRAGPLAALARSYCAATANSIGDRCRLSLGGTSSISAADLELRAAGGIPGSACLFLVGGSGQATPFGNGWLCAGPPIERFDPFLSFDALGSVSLSVDPFDSPLASGPLAVSPGDKRYLQLWYRDPSAGPSFYNLSDAIELTFVP